MMSALIGIIAASGVNPSAGQFGWLKGGSKEAFKLFQAPSQRFTVEYPTRDWQPQPAGTTSVLFTQKKSEASVSIEYESLAVPLEAAQIDQTTAGYEVEHIKELLPKADGFKPQVRTENGRRVIVIDYTRPALKDGLERVRQYSLIFGKDIFRIVCSAGPSIFDKYEPVFDHFLTSFTVTGTAR
jgi:hypothetical protein